MHVCGFKRELPPAPRTDKTSWEHPGSGCRLPTVCYGEVPPRLGQDTAVTRSHLWYTCWDLLSSSSTTYFFYFYFLTTYFSEAINYSSHGTEEPSFWGASATTSLSTTIASPPSWQHSESIFPPGPPLSRLQSSTGNFIQLSKQCRVST